MTEELFSLFSSVGRYTSSSEGG